MRCGWSLADLGLTSQGSEHRRSTGSACVRLRLTQSSQLIFQSGSTALSVSRRRPLPPTTCCAACRSSLQIATSVSSSALTGCSQGLTWQHGPPEITTGGQEIRTTSRQLSLVTRCWRNLTSSSFDAQATVYRQPTMTPLDCGSLALGCLGWSCHRARPSSRAICPPPRSASAQPSRRASATRCRARTSSGSTGSCRRGCWRTYGDRSSTP
mmetsp:Transcript_22122/g.59044  ORF Transcript_22122/g.59044 Transcript_22122/m.59044 type:complete len:211 (+) Transcript_22122:1128-1760(+)